MSSSVGSNLLTSLVCARATHAPAPSLTQGRKQRGSTGVVAKDSSPPLAINLPFFKIMVIFISSSSLSGINMYQVLCHQVAIVWL